MIKISKSIFLINWSDIFKNITLIDLNQGNVMQFFKNKNLYVFLFGILFFKLLLFPSKGLGKFDNSLFGNNYSLLPYFICIFVLTNVIVLAWLYIKDIFYTKCIFFVNILSLLILIFVCTSGSNSNTRVLDENLYFYANLLFGFLIFSVFIISKYICKELLIAFPFITIISFTLYSFLIIYALVTTDFSSRLEILFDHPNYLGNALAFGILFLSFSILAFKNKILKCIICIVIFVLILGMVATLSRGAWLSLISGLLFGSILIFIYSNKKADFLKLLLGLIAFIAISVAIVNPNRISERFDISIKDTEISTMNRITLWKTSLQIIKDHPLLGVGLGNFGNVLDKNYKTEFLNDESFATALNNYLTLAAEVGIPITLLYIFIVIYALVLAVKSIKQSKNRDVKSLNSKNKYLQRILMFVEIDNYFYIKIGMLAGVISLLIFGLTTYTLTRVYSNLLIWSSLGYILADYKTRDK